MAEHGDLDGVSAELYALDPDEFTESRNARAQQAKADGDRDLAARIRRLRKPSTAAWAANLLARHHPETVAGLLDLGGALQQAQHHLDGDRLRELGRERRNLTKAVADQAEALATEAGRELGASVRAQLEETVRAAITDPDAGAALAAGRLTEALTATGWPATDAASLLAAPPTPRPSATKKTPPRPDRKAKQREAEEREAEEREAEERRRQQALAEARDEARVADRAARTARDQLQKTERRVADLTQRRRDLGDTAEDLRARMRRLEQQVAELDEDVRVAAERHDEAERREQETSAAAEQAQRKVADLD